MRDVLQRRDSEGCIMGRLITGLVVWHAGMLLLLVAFLTDSPYAPGVVVTMIGYELEVGGLRRMRKEVAAALLLWRELAEERGDTIRRLIRTAE
jgi:hypothetical protein